MILLFEKNPIMIPHKKFINIQLLGIKKKKKNCINYILQIVSIRLLIIMLMRDELSPRPYTIIVGHWAARL